MENRRKTTNYIPEPKFQFRFIRVLVLGSFVQMALICAILYYFLGENYRILVKYAGLEPDVTNVLYRELRILVGVLVSVFTLHLLAVAVLGVLFSHRVGGAVYAMKRTMAEIVNGKDARLKLRKGDEFQEVQDLFNEMIDTLKSSSHFTRAANER